MDKAPVYRIKKTKSRFESLKDADFSKASPALFKETVTGKAPRQPGTAKLLYNATSLLAFFDVSEDSPVATFSTHDSELYNENVVELFLSPLGNNSLYYEIEVNPLNATFDALIINDIGKGKRRGPSFQGFTGWNPKSLKTRSVVASGKWRVFLSIDFVDLFLARRIPPKKGDTWKGNMLRIDYNGKDREYCAWSPTFVLDFHNSNRFGTWIFD
jgi:hypothetical protein